MDSRGFLGMKVLVGSSPCSFSPPLASSDLESIRKGGLLSSHFHKQGKSCRAEEDDQRSPKIARSISFSSASNGEQMLSFSSSKSSSLGYSCNKTSPLATLPSSSAPSPQLWNADLNSGDLNVKMQRALRGPMGAFTLSQRMELKQQMLLYNYIWANVPIPTNLLSSLMRGLNPAWFSACSSGSLRPNAAWWGYFHPGYVGNADPEPGRCRRTDGKKWRCSRDAVPDQKYCERHINRGRHRSRKPVEGQGDHAKRAISGVTNPTSVSPVTSGISQGTANASSSQFWLPAGGNTTNDHKDAARDLPILTSTAKPYNTLFTTSKNYDPLSETSSLKLNSCSPFKSHLRGSFLANNSLVTPLDLHDQQSQQPHGLDHFINNWPPCRPESSNLIWPVVEETQAERTQLAMPFHLASSDFSSSTSSPAPERLSPLHMGLGLMGVQNERNSVMKWRATSMGGPLGEVLTSTSSTPVDENKNFLSLINEGWDLTPQLASSTNNVIQSATVSSVSSGSANDVKVEKTANEGLSCLFGSNHVNSLNLPSFVSI
ncbi:growth-regulating factor 6-like [Phalaenopsis equestris]|uniref:growth-regulating factor 6-like n=1 Tax=Phalaenopsis equestris TaxID=78828 RepID=UPI0009E522AD|nr:growth-regulating factor 6-like [Phalaenopsis equestris]